MVGRIMARTWRSLRRRARQVIHLPHVELIYHPRYAQSLTGLPHDVLRADRILAFLINEGLIGHREVHAPAAASYQSLRRVHQDSYLESLHHASVLTGILGTQVSEREVDGALDLQRLMAGGTLMAAELALTGRIAVNLGGGFHHARPDRGHGFCVFNDLAMAVTYLRARGFTGRVLVIDLDLHDGDGTRIAFAEDATVHTFSIHNQTWDSRPALEATCVELGAAVDDATYLATIDRHLPAVLGRFDPGLVLYVAGTDPAIDDRIGDWKITATGMFERDRRVLELVRPALSPRPLAIVLGGGYGQDAWRYSARLLALILTGERVDPPETAELTLLRLRPLARALDPAALAGDEELVITEDDVADALGLEHRRSRFLDYYSEHGVELALERLGLFDQLRSLGFRKPTLRLELDPRRDSGDLLRIYGDAAQTELLVEVRLRRDRAVLPGMELLSVEWLLLQNPRLVFSEYRRRLPGQAYPGLGVLDEVVSLFVLVCERLELDGLVFVPAHYHLAAQSLGRLRFLRPEDQAHFETIQRAAQGQSLEHTSWALEHGELRDEEGRPLQWRPAPMVFPVSERLRERLGISGPPAA
ncbi:MAG: histone deacetylase [Deltaproteobacteria bacterium]|nr:histone deacetylase [Deltaproteobacteria bacterium]